MAKLIILTALCGVAAATSGWPEHNLSFWNETYIIGKLRCSGSRICAPILLLSSGSRIVCVSWSMSGYACSQPQLYSQCNCPSFCSGYMQQPQYYQQPCGYSGGCSGGGGGYYPRRRHHKHKKPRRKFRFDSDEDVDLPPSPPRKPKVKVHHSEEGFIEEKRVTAAPSKSDSSWENEDLWEKKFVTESTKLDSEEFPEITSEEIEEAMRRKTTMAPRPVPVQPAPQPAGGGLGGLGLGNGGLFGISSGVGVGVPGVGPIGVSSGLGIGK